MEIALYDLFGQRFAAPTYRLLGGGEPAITTDVTISVDYIDKMVADAIAAVDRGFGVLKIKVGKDPGVDVERVKAVHAAIADRAVLRLDANQGWTPKQAVRALQQLKSAGIRLDLVEQPVKAWDIAGMVYVSERVTVPIMADESVFSASDVVEIIRRRAADIINIKLVKTGGISQAVRIADLAAMYGVECMIGCMLEGAIGVAAAAHVAVAKSDVITRVDLDGPYPRPLQPGREQRLLRRCRDHDRRRPRARHRRRARPRAGRDLSLPLPEPRCPPSPNSERNADRCPRWTAASPTTSWPMPGSSRLLLAAARRRAQREPVEHRQVFPAARLQGLSRPQALDHGGGGVRRRRSRRQAGGAGVDRRSGRRPCRRAWRCKAAADRETRALNTPETLGHAARWLADADTLFVAGGGIDGDAAHTFAGRIALLGRRCIAHRQPHDLHASLSAVTSRDVLLVICGHDSPAEWLRCCREMRAAGGRVVVVTRPQRAVGESAVDACLLVSAHDPQPHIEELVYEAAMRHLLDDLFLRMLAARPDTLATFAANRARTLDPPRG